MNSVAETRANPLSFAVNSNAVNV